MLLVEVAHQSVAMHLRHYRRSSNRERQRVAVEKPRLRAGMIEPHRIDQQMVRRNRQRLHGAEHGDTRRLVDVDPVDGLCVHLGHRNRQSHLANAKIELLTLLAGQLLGVFQPRTGECIHAPR
jgi:hypothetical protein